MFNFFPKKPGPYVPKGGTEGQVLSKNSSKDFDTVWTEGGVGATGPTGVFGGDSQPYTYSTTTTDSDPGSGVIRFDNTTLSSATKAYIDLVNSDSVDVTTWIDALDDSSSAIKGTLRVVKKTDQSIFHTFQINAANITAMGYRKLNLTYVTGNGSFVDTEEIVISFTRQGDTGAPGPQGDTGANGSTLGKQSLWISAGSWQDGVVTPSYVVSSGTYNFPKAVAKDIIIRLSLPKSWDAGDISYKVYYRQISTSSGGVAWGLKVASHSDGDSSTPSYGAQVVITDTAGLTDKVYITSESASVSIGNTPAKEDFLTLNLQRVVSNAADTLAVNVQLYGVMLYYTTDALTDD